MATGPSGIGPGAGGIPLTTEWLQAQKKALKEAGKTDATEKASDDISTLSSAAKELSSTRDERMLKSMRAELSNLDTNSETFMQDATEKLIDSVIDQEYGEHFKGKPGYASLQEKLTQTVLDNPTSREALSEFFELLLLTENIGDEDEEQSESGEDEDDLDEDENDEDENEDQDDDEEENL